MKADCLIIPSVNAEASEAVTLLIRHLLYPVNQKGLTSKRVIECGFETKFKIFVILHYSSLRKDECYQYQLSALSIKWDTFRNRSGEKLFCCQLIDDSYIKSDIFRQLLRHIYYIFQSFHKNGNILEKIKCQSPIINGKKSLIYNDRIIIKHPEKTNSIKKCQSCQHYHLLLEGPLGIIR